MKTKILIIEDDEGVRTYLKELLLDNGYFAETSSDGVASLELLKKSLPDLVLLDLGLPKITGEALCSEIRKSYPDLPIIILTAKDGISDIVRGLNLGADDYITKPFTPEVLLARIAARLRSKEGSGLRVGDLEINNKNFTAIRAGKEIALSPHEFKLLEYLSKFFFFFLWD